jgi:iron uptake system EfeUOB component EfeO/EfeM
MQPAHSSCSVDSAQASSSCSKECLLPVVLVILVVSAHVPASLQDHARGIFASSSPAGPCLSTPSCFACLQEEDTSKLAVSSHGTAKAICRDSKGALAAQLQSCKHAVQTQSMQLLAGTTHACRNLAHTSLADNKHAYTQQQANTHFGSLGQ